MRPLLPPFLVLLATALLTGLNQRAEFIQTQLSSQEKMGAYLVFVVLVPTLALCCLAAGLTRLLGIGQDRPKGLRLVAALTYCLPLPFLAGYQLTQDSEFTTQLFTVLFMARGYI